MLLSTGPTLDGTLPIINSLPMNKRALRPQLLRKKAEGEQSKTVPSPLHKLVSGIIVGRSLFHNHIQFLRIRSYR